MTVSGFFFVLALVSMVGVLLSLFGGVIAMTKGTEKDHQSSQKMMKFRVMLQGLALLFLILAAAGG